MLGAQETDRTRQALRTSRTRELTEIEVPVADPRQAAADGEIARQQKPMPPATQTPLTAAISQILADASIAPSSWKKSSRNSANLSGLR